MRQYLQFLGNKTDEYIRDFTSLGNPFLLLLVSYLLLGWGMLFFTVMLGLALNESIGSLIKLLFPKNRPKRQARSNILERIDSSSFPSIHASRIMFVYLMLISATGSPYVWSVLVAVILAVGYSRIHLKKHYLADVIGGYVFGIIIYFLANIII